MRDETTYDANEAGRHTLNSKRCMEEIVSTIYHRNVQILLLKTSALVAEILALC